MKRLKVRRTDGFSLIEVIIGLIILAIGLLAVGSLQMTSVRGNFFSSNLTQATYVAQDGLESLKNLSFTSNDLKEGTYPLTATPILGVSYDRTYTVTNNADESKTITYTVSWNDGVPRSITFSTIRIP